jgi:hypothetical protein
VVLCTTQALRFIIPAHAQLQATEVIQQGAGADPGAVSSRSTTARLIGYSITK